MKLLNAAAGVCLAIVLAGCTSTPQLMPTPNIYTTGNAYPESTVSESLKSNTIEVLFLTDRAPEADSNGVLHYGSGRSASLAFGAAIVEIGDDLAWQELVEMSSTPSRPGSPRIRVRSRTELGRFPATPHAFHVVDGQAREDPAARAQFESVAEKLREQVRRQMESSGHNEVHVFVHGFNNTFDWSAATIAELWHFLGRRGVPVLYSWPAAHGGLLGYFVDRESGEFTIFHLKSMIRLLASFPEVERINVIAHSRGTDVATTALRELIIEARASGRDPESLYRIDNLIMAAPDLDFDVVRQRLIAEKVGPAFGQITVYTTESDLALAVSQTLMSGTRFGRIRTEDLGEQEQAIFSTVKNVAFIDVQGVGGLTGHAYYLDNPAASSDIIRVITTGELPGSTERPLNHRMLNFWEMPQEYLGARN